MFFLNSTLNFGIPPVLVFQLEVYYKVDRHLIGLTAQPKGTTAQWYSNKTSVLRNKKTPLFHNKSLNQAPFLFLNIPVTNSVNRRDLGHSFDLGVDRSNHNLVVSGPPAPYAGFPGTSTYYQRSYGHVTPFLAFGGYKPQYP